VVPAVAAAGPVGALRCSARAGLLQPLLDRLRGAGVQVTTIDTLPDETLALGDVPIALTDGRTAAERAAANDGAPLILLDLARDYTSATHLGATANAGGAAQFGALAALLGAAHITLIALADVAGLVLMRTVCCLANEAADVMTWTGTKAADIDIAMVLGTAYPVGPLAWADAVGEVRYRRAPALTRLHFGGGAFHG